MCIGLALSMIHRANMAKTPAIIIFSFISIGLFYMFLLANN
jgi:hypothetical protein